MAAGTLLASRPTRPLGCRRLSVTRPSQWAPGRDNGDAVEYMLKTDVQSFRNLTTLGLLAEILEFVGFAANNGSPQTCPSSIERPGGPTAGRWIHTRPTFTAASGRSYLGAGEHYPMMRSQRPSVISRHEQTPGRTQPTGCPNSYLVHSRVALQPWRRHAVISPDPLVGGR